MKIQLRFCESKSRRRNNDGGGFHFTFGLYVFVRYPDLVFPVLSCTARPFVYVFLHCSRRGATSIQECQNVWLPFTVESYHIRDRIAHFSPETCAKLKLFRALVNNFPFVPLCVRPIHRTQNEPTTQPNVPTNGRTGKRATEQPSESTEKSGIKKKHTHTPLDTRLKAKRMKFRRFWHVFCVQSHATRNIQILNVSVCTQQRISSDVTAKSNVKSESA